jgi:hypothetical protein
MNEPSTSWEVQTLAIYTPQTGYFQPIEISILMSRLLIAVMMGLAAAILRLRLIRASILAL